MTDLDSKLRALHNDYVSHDETCLELLPDHTCALFSAIRTAADLALEAAAALIEATVAEHRDANPTHRDKGWCEDYGCTDLLNMAAEIRASLRTRGGSGVG